MNLWLGVIVASAAVYSWKLVGFLIPTKSLKHPRVADLAALVTVALLSGLVGVQTLVSDSKVEIDARLPAVLVAVVLMIFRAPFIVVVTVAAAVAALLRLWLWN
jgi:branched-subunit amino acid transport protein